jgi:hypothetical protein
MRTITITTYASMPSRFKVWHSAPGRRDFGRDAAGGAGEAAAIAIEYARATGGPYVILGHKEALDMIPAELRFKSA